MVLKFSLISSLLGIFLELCPSRIKYSRIALLSLCNVILSFLLLVISILLSANCSIGLFFFLSLLVDEELL